jgi:hypothetical protein
MLHRYMLRLLLVRNAKTVLLVGALAVRNRTNGLRKVAVLHRAVSFYGIGPNEKYATRSQGYLIKWKYKLEVAYRCFFWP